MSTHIRAGEIIARRVDNVTLTYEFTFFGYRDQEGVLFGQGRFDFGDGEIYGDDPDEPIPWTNIVDLGNGVERWEFTLVHTYQAPNNYLVSYTEDFRNADIQNITGSVNTSFYVETLIVIDPLIGENNTPVFTVPPIDQGVVGFRFEHNPGAFDPDGDSLSYSFSIPLKGKGDEVDGYRSLIDPSFYENFNDGAQEGGPPQLTIDEVNGTLVWDAPGGVGIPPLDNREYNVAFIVEEWRQINGVWIRLGFVKRDMQIIIWNFENNPPEIELPPDTCVIAGDVIVDLITSVDPDNDPIKLEAFGGPFEVNAPVATFTPNPPEFQLAPAVLQFQWQTVCGHVRARPYEVQFKATDQPTIPNFPSPPGSVNFETWQITVVGPAPTGLTADTRSGRAIQLDWDNYSCPNADSIQVWRRVGEFEVDPNCNPGIPENSGYELVDVLDVSETSLLDTNDGLGLSPGSKYCYRLVATFPGPTGGLSIASEEACDSLVIDVPIITNVDIETTSETEGEILVRWTPPYQIDASQFPPDYRYTLLRTTGRGPEGDFEAVVENTADTVFTDTGLNTEDLFHAYKVVLYTEINPDDPIDTSAVASSIRLEPIPQVGSIRLNWSGNTPWSLIDQDYPEHYIWRDNVDNDDLSKLEIIDTVRVSEEGLTYLDDGRFNGVALNDQIEYCYLVTTQGSYDNALIPAPLVNNTQSICAQPNDEIAPCTPIAISFDTSAPFSCEVNSVDQGCDFNDFQNRLVWGFDESPECDDDIQKFRVYFADTGESEEFVLLAETQGTSFIHGGLSSYAGCYKIAAVDRSGNESILSETFCNDNCPQLVMPNVFTPNDDGINDFFRPFYSGSRIDKDVDGFINTNCPRFVKSINFTVFNRAGATVFSYDSSENEGDYLINWDGKSSSGQELASGTYFYSAEVTFERLNPDDELEVYNGWVQLLR